MAKGILILGLNGCGKTTLGRCLAARLGWQHMDAEDYFFLPAEIPFTRSRPKAEAEALLRADIARRGDFVLSSVNPDWAGDILAQCVLAVLLTAPAETRLERLDRRERLRFGARVEPGGDMFAAQQRFRAFAAGRDPAEVAQKAEGLGCPVLRLESTKDVEALADAVTEALNGILADVPGEIDGTSAVPPGFSR